MIPSPYPEVDILPKPSKLSLAVAAASAGISLTQAQANQFAGIAYESHETVDGGYGGVEVRRYGTVTVPPEITEAAKWKGLQTHRDGRVGAPYRS